jgi:hypothetical protein
MRSTCLAAILLLSANLAVAADVPAPAAAAGDQGKWVSLFDGKTLNGWKVTGCVVTVEDGTMLLKSGNGMVQSERTYRDFILEVEWKALKPDNWDSGVFIRCGEPPRGRPWPQTYQANLRKGIEGNIAELKETIDNKGLPKAHQWNHFRLTVVGTTVALDINGQRAWKADGLKTPSGYIGLQAEVPGGGQFLFRNIRIQELDNAR